MDRDNPRGVAALEAVLESAQETARKSLDLAQSINRREDDYAQDIAFNRAIAFMKVSAKVGMALAKLKGEHTSNVTICRTEVHAPRVELRRPRAVTLETPSPARADAIAAEWMKAHGMKDGDDWPELYPDDEDDEDNASEGRANQSAAPAANGGTDAAAGQGIKGEGSRGEGDPPPIFGGSNTGK